MKLLLLALALPLQAATLHWNARAGALGYGVIVDGRRIATVTGTSWELPEHITGTKFAITVLDQTGAASAPSPSLLWVRPVAEEGTERTIQFSYDLKMWTDDDGTRPRPTVAREFWRIKTVTP